MWSNNRPPRSHNPLVCQSKWLILTPSLLSLNRPNCNKHKAIVNQAGKTFFCSNCVCKCDLVVCSLSTSNPSQLSFLLFYISVTVQSESMEVELSSFGSYQLSSSSRNLTRWCGQIGHASVWRWKNRREKVSPTRTAQEYSSKEPLKQTIWISQNLDLILLSWVALGSISLSASWFPPVGRHMSQYPPQVQKQSTLITSQIERNDVQLLAGRAPVRSPHTHGRIQLLPHLQPAPEDQRPGRTRKAWHTFWYPGRVPTKSTEYSAKIHQRIL
jgi:hypothetical protein